MSDIKPIRGLSELEVCRRTSKLLSEEREASFEAQARALARSGAQVQKAVLQGFASYGRTPRNLRFVEPLSVHFRQAFPKVWERARLQLEMEMLGIDSLTLAVNHLLGLGQNHDKSRLARLAGCYAAYRPFFRNNADTMVMSLLCGVDGDISRFQLGMTYLGEAGLPRRDVVEGRIIPYEQSFLFMGNIAGDIAPVVFIVSRNSLTAGKYERCEGTIMVGAQSALPTASALIIYWKHELPEERVIALGDDTDIPEWHSVKRALSRGFVKWN